LDGSTKVGLSPTVMFSSITSGQPAGKSRSVVVEVAAAGEPTV
jgi:hypothetical protein